MFRRVRLYLEMIRFGHTVFALPFALSSAALAWVMPLPATGEAPGFQWLQLLGIVLCMVFARSAAMAFNRLADRHYDAGNPRTAQRHLPTGQLSVISVWLFTLFSAAAFVASTLIFLCLWDNPWPPRFAGPVLIFLCAYSYTKRFTSLAHFWLGTSLFLAPVAAWIAIRGIDSADLADLKVPLLLGLAVLFWVSGFDILYACQDVEFDRKSRLRSIPARLGVPAALRVALACHVVMVLALGGLYWAGSPPLGPIFLTGLAAVAILLAYEHWLVRPDDLSRVNRAFFNVNGVISIGLFAVILLQLALQ
jgi:4-hydroxybenzoate polyprenyltransferase